MTHYWLGVILLTVVAAGILLLPWIRKSNRKAKDELSNTQIIKQRMLELEREVTEGLLTENDKELAIKELKLALIDESTQEQQQRKSAKWVLSVGMIVTLSVCGFLYLKANEIGDIQHWQQVQSESAELAKRIVVDADPSITGEDIQDFALAMRTKLLTTPDDHIGWLLLGRLQASIGRADEALQAFAKAYEIAPDHPGILSSYSQTLVMTGEESSLKKAQRLIKRSIELNPQDINAFGLLAVAATNLGDTELAIASWQRLKDKLPKADPMQGEIDKRLSQLGVEVEQPQQTSVAVSVNIAEEMLAKLPRDGFLFVFAQDANGQVRMPAAVVKQALPDLPVTVTLSDANAMMPTYTLSQLRDVKLVARVSLDENVAQNAGELEGEVVVTLEPGSTINQQLVIDKELN